MAHIYSYTPSLYILQATEGCSVHAQTHCHHYFVEAVFNKQIVLRSSIYTRGMKCFVPIRWSHHLLRHFVYKSQFNSDINVVSASQSNHPNFYSLFPYSGLRATIRYMGVNRCSLPPATRQSAARAKLSAVFLVPAGARPMVSRAPARL